MAGCGVNVNGSNLGSRCWRDLGRSASRRRDQTKENNRGGSSIEQFSSRHSQYHAFIHMSPCSWHRGSIGHNVLALLMLHSNSAFLARMIAFTLTLSQKMNPFHVLIPLPLTHHWPGEELS